MENVQCSMLNEKAERRENKLTYQTRRFTLIDPKPSRAKDLGVSKTVSVFFDNYT
jgi:hypothetical protein